MTPLEMQIAFSTEMAVHTNLPPVLSDDIFYFLNKAQHNYVVDNFTGFNKERRKFEQSQPLIDALKILVKKDVLIPVQYAGEDAAFNNFQVDRAPLPENNLFILSHRSKVLYDVRGRLGKWELTDNRRYPEDDVYNLKLLIVNNRFSQQDDIYRMLEDPFNTTKFDSPITDINENWINIYTDKHFIVSEVLLNYLRRPQTIGLDPLTPCELPEYVHQEIVEKAVNLYLRSRQKQRQQPVVEEQS
jgi:hypothetical protein